MQQRFLKLERGCLNTVNSHLRYLFGRWSNEVCQDLLNIAKNNPENIFLTLPEFNQTFPKIYRYECHPSIFKHLLRSAQPSLRFSKKFWRSLDISEDIRRLPRSLEELPKMFWSCNQKIKYSLRKNTILLKPRISLLVKMYKYTTHAPDVTSNEFDNI